MKGGQEKERRKYIHYTYIVKLGSRELSLFSATAESNFSARERERERKRVEERRISLRNKMNDRWE